MKRSGPWVLGLASSSHNGAACLLKGGEIVVAIQEERISRIKRARLDAGGPSLAVQYCLDTAGIGAKDLDMVVACVLQDKHLKRHQPEGNPLLERASCPKVQISHHLGHAISVFATSGHEHAAVLVVDGAGSTLADLTPSEQALATIPPTLQHVAPEILEAHSMYEMSLAHFTPVEKQMGWWLTEVEGHAGMKPFGSLGGMYSSVSEQIFGDPFNGPGKVMGLSPYGHAVIPADEFIDLSSLHLAPRTNVPKMFDFADRWPRHRERYQDLAASTQAALELALLRLVRRIRDRVPADALCYAGGVALNSVANERLRRESGFKDFFILPAAEDSGTAIGAAYYGLWQLEQPRARRISNDSLGRRYSTAELEKVIASVPAVDVVKSGELISSTVDLLIAGQFVGWFQGGAEFGPRALGHRSILCDPRRADMKEKLNAKIKHREEFRPFAPVVLAEEVDAWFDAPPPLDNPFMLQVWPFKRDVRHLVPAVVHVDGTGRVQVVTRESNQRLHAVLREFFRRTGVPLLLNTSLNVSGQPIVETPQDALRCLLETELDCCVIQDLLVTKSHPRR